MASINASTSGAGGIITTADNTGILNIQTAGTTAVTVNASQNVGIGTTSPSQVLTVNGRLAFSNLFAASNIDGIFLQSGVGTTVNTATGNNIAFNSGTTERMRIDSNGTVCINTTAPPFSDNRFTITYSSATQSAASIKNTSTTFNGNMWSFLNSSNASCGAITQSGTTTTAFTTSSDYRLKENIAPMTGALYTVDQLKPVTYTWKEDGSAGQGFIAHELAEVCPDAVSGEKDAVDAEGNPKYQGVDTSFLVATLTAAIQEQTQIINDLKARITALEGAA